MFPSHDPGGGVAIGDDGFNTNIYCNDNGYIALNTPSHARINGYLSISATSTYTGQIGFNRDVNTGAIFNSSNAAYQINGYQTYLLLEGYNSSGTNTFIHRFPSHDLVTVVDVPHLIKFVLVFSLTIAT